jgi:WD40 repeat protein
MKLKDGKLTVWNGFTSTKDHFVQMKSKWAMTVCFSPSGFYVASSGLENRVSFYELMIDQDISNQKKTIANHRNFISCIKFLVSDQQLLTASGGIFKKNINYF